jgi:hypothetical protein
MFGKPTGKVRLRHDDNTPCAHEYTGSTIGRCLTRNTCKHCGDQYEVDSSD